ncbi:hypothetical protein SY88_09965 [Clostridiales bacterium PH28_bin88]|nr:hypothetical protein SY88_09965 [Clostridiales bacterium PH28_bin88]
MSVLNTVLGAIDKTNEWLAKIASWSMVLLVFTMTYEVVSRYVFRAPTIWSYDMSYFLSSIMLMFGMAYTLKVKGHVNIDIFYGRLSGRGKAVLDVIFALLLFFPLWVLMVKAMIPHVIFAWKMHEKSWVGTWLPAVYPFKTWVTVGTITLLLQGTAEFIRDLTVAVTGGERP